MIISSTLLLIGQMLAVASSPTFSEVAPNEGHASYLVLPSVAGRVITEAGEPLPGVFVAVQGTPQATSTNAAGNFLLTLTTTKSVLVFKCQGYRDQSMAVSVGPPLTVKMYAVSPLTSGSATSGSTASGPAMASVAASDAPTVLAYSDELPSFPGGEAAYRKYVSQNAHFPEEALAKGASGTVYISFVVDEQGRIINAEIAKGCGHGLDQEALRIIRLMPWWTPGRMAGKPVRVARTMPVFFAFREQN